MPRRAAGRPPLPEGYARTEQYRIRFTPEEKALLEGAAQPGLLAQWIRETLLRAAARRQPTRRKAAS